MNISPASISSDQDSQQSAFFQSALAAAQQAIQNSLAQATPDQAAALSNLSSQIATLQSAPGGLSRADRREILSELNQQLSALSADQSAPDPATATQSDAATDPGYAAQDAFQVGGAGSAQDPSAQDSSQFNVADPTAALTDGASRLGRSHHGHKVHHEAMAVVADDLGMSPQDLRSALQSGQSVADLAQQQNISLDQLNADVTSKLSASFPQASPQMLAGMTDRILQR